MIRQRQKQSAAKAAAAFVKDGMTIGIGTGSTVYYLIQELGAYRAAGRDFCAVPTSLETERLAKARGIDVRPPEEVCKIDLAIDGVDEVDRGFCAVKGGGGALLREKAVASKAEEVIWIMDEGKLAERLGRVLLPVETLPFCWSWVADGIREAGGQPSLRKKDGQIFLTDNGNYILDIRFGADADYRKLSGVIRQIPGVLETGYFDRMCTRMLVGTETGVRELINPHRNMWDAGRDVERNG